MDFKTFWNSTTAFVLKNFFIAAIIVAVLIVGAVKWLGSFTHHGEEVVVPTITGLYVEEAQILAGNEGLTIQVIDSTYSKKEPLGTIVEQNPRAESNAKRGRTVYVIVNAKTVAKCPFLTCAMSAADKQKLRSKRSVWRWKESNMSLLNTKIWCST